MKMVNMSKTLAIWLLICSVIMCPTRVMAQNKSTVSERHAISIVLDVSGSMKKTDAERHSIEMIKLFMDLCSDADYLNVTAYNDAIVYQSGLVSMGDEVGKQAMIEALDELQFHGETDNGLGLIAATDAIVESGIEYDNAFIVLITDGNTDLKNSTTDRTTEDSDADMQASAQKAKENDITINVIGYTDAYNKDTGLLSVLSASTGGSSTIVDNPPQFIQVFLGVFFSEYSQGKVSLESLKSEENINRYQSEVDVADNQKYYEVIFTTEKMLDCEVTNATESIVIHRGNHYLIQEIGNPGKYELKTVYSVAKPTVTVVGNVIVDVQNIEPEKEDPVVEPDMGAAPAGQDFYQELFSSDEKFIMDVSTLFDDEDKDIVGYVVDSAGTDVNYSISGSMLTIDTKLAGNYQYKVTAVDSKQNQKTITFEVEVHPAWMKYQNIIIIAVICAIAAGTIISSIYIIKRLLFVNAKEKKAISGYLQARFINLRSKNEPVDILWDLSDYPPEGVTLEELFLSRRIRENFKDIDKVCFYPGKHPNEITLVHCMEGGVFLGEQNVKPNVPATIYPGAVLYFAFAENASEIEVKYTTNG